MRPLSANLFALALLAGCTAVSTATPRDAAEWTMPAPSATLVAASTPTPAMRGTATSTPRIMQVAELARSLPPPPVQTEFGVQIDGCDAPVAPAIQLAKETGFTWIKQQARWGDMQPTPNRVDWSCLDRVILVAASAGMKVLISVTTAPAYLRAYARDTLGPPDNFEPFAIFLHALLTRYLGQIHALECWNEPNLSAEWREYIDPVKYGLLLSLCHAAARAIDPSILVISAGLAPTADDSRWTHVDDRWFLRRLIRYNGLSHLDCIGAHANGPDGVGELPAVLARYAEFGYGARPLCFTEFGYALPVDGRAPEDFGWIMAHTAEAQARRLVADMEAARASGRVRLAILFNLNFDDGPDSPNTPYALTRAGFTSPALGAIRAYLEGVR